MRIIRVKCSAACSFVTFGRRVSFIIGAIPDSKRILASLAELQPVYLAARITRACVVVAFALLADSLFGLSRFDDGIQFVVRSGNPVDGPIVARYRDLGTAFYHARLHNDHGSTHYALNEVQAMFQSEIHFALIGFWDGGIEWYLGSSLEWASDRGNAPTVEEAIVNMTNAARRRYPESTFGRERPSDIVLDEEPYGI